MSSIRFDALDSKHQGDQWLTPMIRDIDKELFLWFHALVKSPIAF
jgi:hypothetical protein